MGRSRRTLKRKFALSVVEDEVQRLRPDRGRPVLQPDDEVDDQPGQPGRHGRPDHVLDVVEEVRRRR